MVTSIPAELYAIEEEEDDDDDEEEEEYDDNGNENENSDDDNEAEEKEALAAAAVSPAKDEDRPPEPSRQDVTATGTEKIRIGLDARERALFEVLLRTAKAYRAGRIRIGNDNTQGDESLGSAAVASSPSFFDNAPSTAPPTSAPAAPLTVRVAGGWVRDKILGLPCHDVDVALDTMTGVQFAQLVQQHIILLQHQQQGVVPTTTTTTAAAAAATLPANGLPPPASASSLLSASPRIGVIAARPEQSKHLETATMRVCGLDVDFLNLRGEEVYEQGSRIPTTRFGTPREDAERRDFTMNSLFYNLHTQSVEDWLDRGLTDLREERLVTPLNALRTFEDDPLRVLRAIRFAVRYKFDLHPDIRHAATHHEIHRALHVKISRERVGKELESMLSGKNARPVAALMTLSDLMLAGSVFCLPLPEINSVRSLRGSLCGYPFDFDTLEGAESEPARLARSIGWQAARAHLDLLPDAMESFLREESRLSLLDDAAAAASAASPVPQSAATDLSSPTRVDRRLLPLATFLLPFRTLHYYHTRKHPNRPVNAVTYIMREGIKFKNSDSAIVTTLMENVEAVAAFLRKYRERQLGAQNKEQQRQQEQTAQQLSSCRLEAGLLLRSLKESWVTCLLLAVVLLQRQQSQVDGATGAAGEPSAVEDWISAGLSLYRHVVIDHRLDRSWTIRPLIDGAALSRALQVPKGPLVAQYLREQVHWMLLNPDGTREGCEAHLALLHKRRLEEVGNAGSQTSSARTSEGEGGGGAPGSGATSEDDGGGMDDVDLLGISDGTGKTPSSPASGRRNRKTSRHFSKKMHVESMDLS